MKRRLFDRASRPSTTISGVGDMPSLAAERRSGCDLLMVSDRRRSVRDPSFLLAPGQKTFEELGYPSINSHETMKFPSASALIPDNG